MAITISSLLKGIRDKGYDAELTSVVKNGLRYNAITLPISDDMRTVAYVDDITRDYDDIDEAISSVISSYRYGKANAPTELQGCLKDSDWVIDNITIGLQRNTDERIVKKDTELDGIEQYLMVKGVHDDSIFTAKVTPELLRLNDISEDDAWFAAMSHVCRDSRIGVFDLCEPDGVRYVDVNGIGVMDDSHIPFYVLTNADKNRGAASVLDKRILRDFCKAQGGDSVIVLPSSIHEVLLLPQRILEQRSIDDFSDMVRDVNGTEVDPKDVLGDKAYVIKVY